MSDPTVVYLVEVNTDPEPAQHTKYFAHVYLSRAKAKAGVEHWAERGGHGAVRWADHGGVLYAYPAGRPRRELYRIVPLRVHPDHQPEPLACDLSAPRARRVRSHRRTVLDAVLCRR